jgi:hypothetical protein
MIKDLRKRGMTKWSKVLLHTSENNVESRKYRIHFLQKKRKRFFLSERRVGQNELRFILREIFSLKQKD